MRKSLVAHQLNWISIEKLNVPLQVKAQIRSRHEAADATIYPLDSGTVRVHFDSAQRAITPGQAVVFYQSDIVVGGGWIRSSE
jgi:tRNA-specific 2-thiouridylase